MKELKTEFDEFGWRLIVKKGKDTYHIYLRSREGNHNLHKPFYLRLNKKNLTKLKKLLTEIENEPPKK